MIIDELMLSENKKIEDPFTRRRHNAGLMFDHRLWRWPHIKRGLVFLG